MTKLIFKFIFILLTLKMVEEELTYAKKFNRKHNSKNIQWCNRCKTQHKMPRCEFIALPVSEGGHIPDWFYKLNNSN